MNTILICFGIAFLCFFILYMLSKNDKKKETTFYSVYTSNGLQLIKHLESLVQDNKTLPYLGYMDLYQKMFNEKPETHEEYETAIGIKGYDDLDETAPKYIAGQYLEDLQWVLAHRHRNEFEELYKFDETETMKKFGLNIHSDEFVHEYATKGVDWFEEKTVTTAINYGGLRFNSGGQGVHYTMGSLSIMQNTRTYFNHIDRGSLYITNKRIVFVGKEKNQNRTINLDDILEFSLFRNGFLIGKSNGKKPLIEFGDYVKKPNQPNIPRDHLNRIVRALNRVINRTQFVSLEK